MATLDEILEQSLRLQTSLEELALHPDLRTIQLGLEETRFGFDDIVASGSSDSTKAHYLLAASGVNAKDTAKTLREIPLRNIVEPLGNVEIDIDAFVRHTKERNIVSIIESRKKQAEIDFHAYLDKHMTTTWQRRKEALITQLGTETGRSRSTAPPPPAPGQTSSQDHNKSVSMARSTWRPRHESKTGQFEDVTIPDPVRTSWDAKAQTFSQAINSLNEHRLMKQPVAICSLMSQLVRSLESDVKAQQLADSWHILSFIVHEKHIEHGRDTIGDLLPARCYAKQYCSPQKDDIDLKRRIADGARRYLETQFFALMERIIARNPEEAKLGGVPSPENKVKAFVNVRFSKHGKWTMPNLELINNSPIWAIIFYLIRAGFLKEAAQYSLKNETSLSKVEKNWCAYMSAYASSPTRKLPRQLAERLVTEYNQRIKFVSENTDPFKHALYKIIGRCDLSRKSLPEVLPVAEDWMWLQLVLVRELHRDDSMFEDFDLVQLQQSLVRFGARHFNAKGNPFLYFQILLLSGQFERSIQYLASHSWIDAVHFAIVLSYYGLLRIPTEKTVKYATLLCFDDDDESIAQLDFAGMLQAYSRQIQRYSSFTSVEYISLICLNSDIPGSGAHQRRLCHESLQSLVLETRDFAALLGDVRRDGTREPGSIERRLTLLELQDEHQYLKTITEHAAAASDSDGRTADAVLLYHLSEEYDIVVQIINRALGDALLDPAFTAVSPDTDLGSLLQADSPAVLAKHMLQLYTSNATIYSSIGQTNKDNCVTLLSIVDSKHQFDLGRHESCLSIINQTGIIPLSDNVSIGFVKGRAQAFALLDDCVSRNVPSLLLLAAKCLKARYEKLCASAYQDPSRQTQVAVLRQKAKNIGTFAGLIKYQMNDSTRIELEETLISIR